MCPHSLFNEYSTYHFTFIAERGEYQDGGQRSARGEAGVKISRKECGRLSGMVFQAPRQPVDLQQANLRNRTRAAAVIGIGQRSGDRSRALG